MDKGEKGRVPHGATRKTRLLIKKAHIFVAYIFVRYSHLHGSICVLTLIVVIKT